MAPVQDAAWEAATAAWRKEKGFDGSSIEDVADEPTDLARLKAMLERLNEVKGAYPLGQGGLADFEREILDDEIERCLDVRSP